MRRQILQRWLNLQTFAAELFLRLDVWIKLGVLPLNNFYFPYSFVFSAMLARPPGRRRKKYNQYLAVVGEWRVKRFIKLAALRYQIKPAQLQQQPDCLPCSGQEFRMELYDRFCHWRGERREETNSTEVAAGSVAKSDLRIRLELIVAI